MFNDADFPALGTPGPAYISDDEGKEYNEDNPSVQKKVVEVRVNGAKNKGKQTVVEVEDDSRGRKGKAKAKGKAKENEEEKEVLPELNRKQSQTFRLGHGSNGNVWIPTSEVGGFQGYVAKNGHISFVGKEFEYDDEEEEGDEEYGDEDQEGEGSVYSERYDGASAQGSSRRVRFGGGGGGGGEDDLDYPDDGYNYEQHMRDRGAGTYIPIDLKYLQRVAKQQAGAQAKKNQGSIVKETKKGELIFATNDADEVEDEEVDYALEHADVVEGEGELDDDFIIQASGGEGRLVQDEADLPPPKEKVRRMLGGLGVNFDDGDEIAEYEEYDEYDDDEYGRYDDVEGAGYDDDEYRGFEHDPDRKIRDLDRDFETAMNLYEEDEIGELDADNPQVMGQRDLSEFEGVLLKNYEDDVRKKRIPYVPHIPKDNEVATVDEYVEAEAEEKEYVYVPETIADKFDCESVLSTYSNLENHPSLIVEKSRRATAKKIELSKKTGMPVGVLPSRPAQQKQANEETEVTPGENLGKARGEESAEEKRLRKKAVKDSKKVARSEKKAYKTAYKQEELRQAHVISTNHTARRVVVKF